MFYTRYDKRNNIAHGTYKKLRKIWKVCLFIWAVFKLKNKNLKTFLSIYFFNLSENNKKKLIQF